MKIKKEVATFTVQVLELEEGEYAFKLAYGPLKDYEKNI